MLVFGNRTMTVVQGNHADETPGGRALRFYASVRVGLKRRDPIRQLLAVVGSRVDATTVRTRWHRRCARAGSISCSARASLSHRLRTTDGAGRYFVGCIHIGRRTLRLAGAGAWGP